jgi:hypothetical protein
MGVGIARHPKQHLRTDDLSDSTRLFVVLTDVDTMSAHFKGETPVVID